MPGKRTIKLLMRNNCPHASPEIVKDFEALKKQQYRQRFREELVIKLAQAYRAKIKSQQELDAHRRAGHPQYSPDCPECKRGAARKRPHKRLQSRMGGELSVDLSGPFIKGLPVTDRREKEESWPRYMVVGAFVPFSPKEAQDRYDQERRDRIAAGLEGPVQMETTVSQKGQTLYFVEVVSSKETKNTSPAILRMINRINNLHKCKAVYRLHADRARELTGEAARNML